MPSKRNHIIKAEAEICENQTCVKVLPKMNLIVNKRRIKKIRKNRQFTCGNVCVCVTHRFAPRNVCLFIWLTINCEPVRFECFSKGCRVSRLGLCFACVSVRMWVWVWRLRGELINYKSRKFAYANLNCQHFWGVYERRAVWHAISWEKCHLQSHLYSQLCECAPHWQLTNPQ